MAKNKDGYTTNGKQYKHREVWERVNGKIPPGSVIHHIDEDKTNNQIDNLLLVESNGIHRRLYHSSIPYYSILPFNETERVWLNQHIPVDRITEAQSQHKHREESHTRTHHARTHAHEGLPPPPPMPPPFVLK